MTRLTCCVIGCVTAVPVMLSPSGASAQDAAALYRQNCSGCHDMGVDRAPGRDAIQTMSAERVLTALESGAMLSMASRLSAAERRAVAQFLTGKTLSAKDLTMTPPEHAMCSGGGGFSASPAAPAWSGWGNNTNNTRYQNTAGAGVTAAEVPRLKVKWAFGFPGDLDANAQPTIAGGRVFVGSQGGKVYALSAATGCIHWFFDARSSVRGAVTIGPMQTGAGPVQAAYFGDLGGNVYAVDATTGVLIWTVKADAHPLARVVGSVVLHNGRLYVPVASAEETAGAPSAYECCRFRGSVNALDAATGRQIWKTFTITEEARPTVRNAAGTQLWGPSGAGVWSSPAIDVSRNVLYATTGDNYSAPASGMSDSFVAMDLDTGRIVWSKQMTAGDAWNTACRMADRTNCPDAAAPDFDFASPPILVTFPTGKRALVAGQKSGMVHAVDPDDQGKMLWQARVGTGGTLGGVQWGSASDGVNVYVALSDIVRTFIPNSFGSNADPKAGGGMFAFNLQTGERVWYTPPPGCGTRALQSGAVRGGHRDPGRRLFRISRRSPARLRGREWKRPVGLRQRRAVQDGQRGAGARRVVRRSGSRHRGRHALRQLGLRARRRHAGQCPARLLRGRPVGVTT